MVWKTAIPSRNENNTFNIRQNLALGVMENIFNLYWSEYWCWSFFYVIELVRQTRETKHWKRFLTVELSIRLLGTTEEERRARGRVGWGSSDSPMFPLLYNPRGKRKIEDHSYSTGECLMIKAVSIYKWPVFDWLLLKLNHIFWESSKCANLMTFLLSLFCPKPFTEHWLHQTVKRNASHFSKRKTQWIAS